MTGVNSTSQSRQLILNKKASPIYQKYTWLQTGVEAWGFAQVDHWSGYWTRSHGHCRSEFREPYLHGGLGWVGLGFVLVAAAASIWAPATTALVSSPMRAPIQWAVRTRAFLLRRFPNPKLTRCCWLDLAWWVRPSNFWSACQSKREPRLPFCFSARVRARHSDLE